MQDTQDEYAEDNLAGLGYPVHVFIDTSTLERLGFPFGLPRLQPLMARIEAGDIQIAISQVIVSEILEHVSDHVDKAEKAYARFKRDTSITRIITDPDIKVVVNEVDWQAVKTAAIASVNIFFATPGVNVLRIGDEDAGGVFADYFARRPPFGEGKKKSEFPDSFAMKALLRHAQSEKCKIAVISEDGDWKKACIDNSELIHCPSIEQVVDYCQKAEAVHHNEIRQLLEVHRDELQLAVIESFKDRGFYWDSDAGYDSEVDETYDEEIESWPWSVIAIEEGWAEIAGDALIHFRSTAIYPDPDSCYRDPDTKELVFFGQVHATLVSRITVQVQVKVNVDSLRQNTLQMDELTVNDDRDIWFCDDEIEEICRDSDTFDE